MTDEVITNVEEEVKDTEVSVQLSPETLEMINEAVVKSAEKVVSAQKKLFLTESATAKKELSDAEKKANESLYFKAVIGGERNRIFELVSDRAKRLSESVDAQGGYLVPESFETRLFSAMQSYGQVVADADRVTMTSNVQRLNELQTKVSVYKITEYGTITASTPTYGEPVLTAQKYGGSAVPSEELIEDSEIDIFADLSSQFGEQLAKALQNEVINGTVSGSEGLLQVAGVTVVTMSATGSYANVALTDFHSMISTLAALDGYQDEAETGKFYMDPATWYAYLNTISTVNMYDPFASQDRTIAGRPVVLANQFPAPTATGTKFVVYGDLSKHLVIGQRRGLRTKINTSGTSASGVELNYQDAREIVITARFANTTVLESGLVCLVS